MHLKPYPFEFVTVTVLDYDCMHSDQHIKEIDTTGGVIHTISYRYDQSFSALHYSSI